jgi:hypothetical protein
MIPVFVIARLPSAMGNEEDLDTGRSRRRKDGAQMVEQTDFIRDILYHRPELSAFREEVIVWINQKQPSP